MSDYEYKKPDVTTCPICMEPIVEGEETEMWDGVLSHSECVDELDD